MHMELAAMYGPVTVSYTHLDVYKRQPRYLSKQLAQVLKAKLLLNRGVMRGDVQDLKDALDLVLTVKKDAPGSWKMEADLAEMYEKGWESGEVLWTRYMGDITNCAWSEMCIRDS